MLRPRGCTWLELTDTPLSFRGVLATGEAHASCRAVWVLESTLVSVLRGTLPALEGGVASPQRRESVVVYIQRTVSPHQR